MLVLSFHHVWSGDQTRAMRLGDKCLHPLSQFAGPGTDLVTNLHISFLHNVTLNCISIALVGWKAAELRSGREALEAEAKEQALT